MTYHYTDASREPDPHPIEDVEVWEASEPGDLVLLTPPGSEFKPGWYYWTFDLDGAPNEDPCGPYDTEDKALAAARESAGFCAHGVSDERICEECPAPELWVLRGGGGSWIRNFGWTDNIRIASACILQNGAEEWAKV